MSYTVLYDFLTQGVGSLPQDSVLQYSLVHRDVHCITCIMAFISVTTETHLTELVVGTPLRDNYLTLFYIVVHHYNQLTGPINSNGPSLRPVNLVATS